MLTKYNPFSLWNDSLFFGNKMQFSPPTDIYDGEKEITIEMEIPGVKLDNIDIKVEVNELKIEGKGQKEEKKEGKGYFRSERFRGSFSRSFLLPKYVDAEDISASYKDGLLLIRIPKRSQSQSKKIEIKA